MRGKKAKSSIITPAGTRVERAAQPVEAMTPGLKEKFTGPMTPMKPARVLPRPVKEMPRVIRSGILSACNTVPTAWMEPRSFIESPRKQSIKAIMSPGSITRVVVI